MLLTYYAIIAVIIVMTVSLASARLVFANTRKPDFDALRGIKKSGRRAIYLLFALMTVMLIMLCVTRDETMNDYLMYERFYSGGEQTNKARELEPTFGMIVGLSPTFFFFLGFYALLSVGSNIYAIVRNSPNIWLSLMIYLLYYFVLHDMIQIRAAVACGLLLIGVRYITEKKWWIYFPLAIISFYFHYSASVFLFLYFLPKKQMNKWIWSAILVLALLFSFTNQQLGFIARFIPLGFVQNYLENYVGNRLFEAAVLGPVRIFKIALIIIMLFKLQTIRKSYPFAPVVLSIYILSNLAYLLFADIPVLQGRLGELLGVSEIFALAMFPMVSRKHYYLLCLIPLALALYNSQLGHQLLIASD